MNKKALVIEDDKNIAELLRLYLEKDGFEVAIAADGGKGLQLATDEHPDVILLDIMLPVMDGWQVCREVRAVSDVPIIMLTAKGETYDKVSGLEMGADDYVTKPFDPDEVAARIHAVLRRAAGASAAAGAGGVCPDDEALVHRDLRLDVARRRVTLGDAEVALTAHEFDILHVLMRSPDKVFSRELLYELVWKNGYYGEQNAVNVHVSNIRKKLAAAGGAGDYIKTVWGIGFKLA